MDILTHTLSGIAVGSAVLPFVRGSFLRKSDILISGGIGAVFPDIDAISLWSKFDSIFGRWFSLSQSGQVIYTEKFWYSHHAFFHSLVAGVLFAALFTLIISLMRQFMSRSGERKYNFIRRNYLLGITFLLGFMAHLLGDLSTPHSAWGGVRMFWPSTGYVGGTGKIWWWNNYDIFLLIVCCIIINLVIHLSVSRMKLQRIAILLVCIATWLTVQKQIHSRQVDFQYYNSTSRYIEFEQKSKDIQKDILGERVYRWMDWLDRKLPFFF